MLALPEAVEDCVSVLLAHTPVFDRRREFGIRVSHTNATEGSVERAGLVRRAKPVSLGTGEAPCFDHAVKGRNNPLALLCVG